MSKSTITNAIDLGEFPDEMLEIIGRFEWLPEFGMRDHLSKLAKQCIKARDAEAIARSERRKARDMAHSIVAAVAKIWTKNEIYQATGYIP